VVIVDQGAIGLGAGLMFFQAQGLQRQLGGRQAMGRLGRDGQTTWAIPQGLDLHITLGHASARPKGVRMAQI
jgi:hypothetical protein